MGISGSADLVCTIVTIRGLRGFPTSGVQREAIMEINDSRASRPHLVGRDLLGAQERFIAAILRGPGLAAAARTAGLNRQHICPELHSAFEFAMSSDRDEIRRAVQSGSTEVARLYRLGVEMGYDQVVHLGRQIKETVDRDRP
jgi:hypothetical protein